MVTLELPFPPSANSIWRRGKHSTYISKQYAAWKKAAGDAFLMQKRGCGTPIDGHFTYHITLNEKRRKVARDGDNRTKVVLDFVQAMGLIVDDKFADAGGWSWGPVEGCTVRLFKRGA
jgi:Holliday junction resolvase RusA-like endonuclease